MELKCEVCSNPYEIPDGVKTVSYFEAKHHIEKNWNPLAYEFPPRTYWTTTYCPKCVTTEAEREIEERQRMQSEYRRQRLESDWAGLCPPLFRKFDVSKLPPHFPALLERVLAWKYGPEGLILHGETGRGKTRAAFQLLKRLH